MQVRRRVRCEMAAQEVGTAVEAPAASGGGERIEGHAEQLLQRQQPALDMEFAQQSLLFLELRRASGGDEMVERRLLPGQVVARLWREGFGIADRQRPAAAAVAEPRLPAERRSAFAAVAGRNLLGGRNRYRVRLGLRRNQPPGQAVSFAEPPHPRVKAVEPVAAPAAALNRVSSCGSAKPKPSESPSWDCWLHGPSRASCVSRK